MKPLRALALAALVGGTALVPHALPAQAEPVKKTVTVMVTSIEMKNDLDLGGGCGEFDRFGMKDTNTGIVTNLIPKGAKVEAWKANGVKMTTLSLCDSTASYPVAQTNLEALANQYDQYPQLFADSPVTATNLNRYHVKAYPGSTMSIAGLGAEWDPTVFTLKESDKKAFPVTVPAAGKSKAFSIPVTYRDSWGIAEAKVWSYTIHGTIITSV